ncbi:hypothetical protein AMAG_11925 [Allomyces macrogynus ATCC 38327]|uniref:Uncharacterized protein n=1 Tax=Allomyces macrogynus (strain ATCC 38327) TaxID=578462 RepID=A0A0L0SY70_ALLM3|nr:hypothetical protein AMAG_11925 [Allomyces macrogynus ATCC 38327]|eukprot:KNE67463.1 hypothetical protein AMAG_11925 [Allomyces macrogynus ATCC 38327]
MNQAEFVPAAPGAQPLQQPARRQVLPAAFLPAGHVPTHAEIADAKKVADEYFGLHQKAVHLVVNGGNVAMELPAGLNEWAHQALTGYHDAHQFWMQLASSLMPPPALPGHNEIIASLANIQEQLAEMRGRQQVIQQQQQAIRQQQEVVQQQQQDMQQQQQATHDFVVQESGRTRGQLVWLSNQVDDIQRHLAEAHRVRLAHGERILRAVKFTYVMSTVSAAEIINSHAFEFANAVPIDENDVRHLTKTRLELVLPRPNRLELFLREPERFTLDAPPLGPGVDEIWVRVDPHFDHGYAF